MNRKQFLKNLGLLCGAAIVAPEVLARTKNSKTDAKKPYWDAKGLKNNPHYINQSAEFFPDELVSIAWWFSERYKHLSAATKFSSYSHYQKNNYAIRYFDIICDKYGEKFKTPTRISHDNKVMEFSKDFFTKTKGITKNSVFYMVLWTWHVLQCDNDLTKCDVETLQYYLSLGLPKKDVHLAWINTFKQSPSEQNRLRLQKIEKFISNQKEIVAFGAKASGKSYGPNDFNKFKNS